MLVRRRDVDLLWRRGFVMVREAAQHEPKKVTAWLERRAKPGQILLTFSKA